MCRCLGVWVFGCLGVWVFGCLGVWVFGCLGVQVFFRCLRVHDISEDQWCDQEGAQKWPKFLVVFNPHIFKRAAKNGQNSIWGKTGHINYLMKNPSESRQPENHTPCLRWMN